MFKITPAAILKIKGLIEEEQNPALKFKIKVVQGGCSGLRYAFSFDTQHAQNDQLITEQGVTVAIDAPSAPILQEATLDYVVGLEGARFILHNEQAKKRCQCGLSFGC